jgi:ATP-dependent DNA helicase RecQ
MNSISTNSSQPNTDPIQAALQRFFGHSSFRPPQREIVECLYQKHDALIVMPTGGGKSICFQLPALMQPGVTLVVSPLVALMENQVRELQLQKLPAALLHSELTKSQYRQTLWVLAQQRLRLLYVSPETLLSAQVWDALCQPKLVINGLVIDEAHCLVQWGDTFRPAYYRLGSVRRSLSSRQPHTKMMVAAFTATADSHTQEMIQRILQLEQPRHFCLNPYRPNLHLAMQPVWTPHQRRQRLQAFIKQHDNQAGLVYVRTRRDSEELAHWLGQQGCATVAYHAGLAPQERRAIEQQWISGKQQFVVCTNAFGMGINHAAVRWIAHFHAPLLLSEYVQEIGRAGRDGNTAIALMLVSERTGWLDSSDKQRRQFFTNQTQDQYRRAKDLIRKLPLEGNVTAVSRQWSGGAIALSLLHQCGDLTWTDPFHYVITGRSALTHLGQSNLQATQQMQQYLTTRQCRWHFLLSAFGFETEVRNWRCGHCDNCHR